MTDDIQAVKNLVYAYAEAFDRGDFDSAVGLFEHATVSVHGSGQERRGIAARALLTDMVQLHDGIPQTKHLTTNLIVDVDGARAVVSSYYVALQAVEGFALQPILAGRWHDRLEKVSGRWRFVDRVIHPDLAGDLSRHIEGMQ